MYLFSPHQFNHSRVKYVTERALVCEQSATWCQTRGSGPVHSASDNRHGCCHIQSMVRMFLCKTLEEKKKCHKFSSKTFLFLAKGHPDHRTEQLPRETEQTGTSPDEHVGSPLHQLQSHKREQFCAGSITEWLICAPLFRLSVLQQEKEMTDNILGVVSWLLTHTPQKSSTLPLHEQLRLSSTWTQIHSSYLYLHVVSAAERAGERLHQRPERSSGAEKGFLRSHCEDSGPAGRRRCRQRRDGVVDCGASYQRRRAPLSG